MTDENSAKTVTIIGAGIGGLYLVAELGIAGFKLRLHDIDDSKLSEIRARGGVDVEGEKGGFAAVEHATSDLRSAVDGADGAAARNDRRRLLQSTGSDDLHVSAD